MFCPSCGKPIETPGQPCPTCGAGGPASGSSPVTGTAQPGTEEELLRFGPFGVSISKKRPGVLVPVMKNCTEVVATDRRLLGLRKPGCLFGALGGGGGQAAFELPWSDVVAMERADFLGSRAIWLQYRAPDGVREVAVIAAVMCHGPLERLWQEAQRLTARS
jgi:hypothetical protein